MGMPWKRNPLPGLLFLGGGLLAMPQMWFGEAHEGRHGDE